MATYVMSDIHGQYDLFIEALKMIDFQETDIIYILGDIIDRGPNPIKLLLKIMEMPNVITLIGNHELMAIDCLEIFTKDLTNQTLQQLDEHIAEDLVSWIDNGGGPTIKEFRELDHKTQLEVIAYINDSLIYEELVINNQKYILVHAGLGTSRGKEDFEDYTISELVWERADYEVKYYDDIYVVSGHTPTQLIEGNPRPGYIYKNNNHIAIDCHCCGKKGRLAVICLDTGEEFYVDNH